MFDLRTISVWWSVKFQYDEQLEKLGFIALKEKGSKNDVSIYFFWRDTDKIISAKHDRHEVVGFWRWKKYINKNLKR